MQVLDDKEGCAMGACEKAQQGLQLLEQAVVELLEEHPEGLRNVDISSLLDIHSGGEGKPEDYLSYSILGFLIKSGVVVKTGKRTYRLRNTR
jgi:hypothetical protein